jgi:hypothetical protein
MVVALHLLGDDGQTQHVLASGLNPAASSLGSASRTSEVEIVHEGIHGLRAEQAMTIGRFLDVQPYRSGHQGPYNEAAQTLLGSE